MTRGNMARSPGAIEATALMLLAASCMLHSATCDEMTEEQIAAAREDALGKLDKPLEKMRIKELLALMSERGVTCKNCKGAEKSEIIQQVKASLHLPKKEKQPEPADDKKESMEDLMAKLKGNRSVPLSLLLPYACRGLWKYRI